METRATLDELQGFRTALYGCFLKRADALFELTEALLSAGPVLSPAHLSLQAGHRRGWGSLYAALTAGRLDVGALRRLVVRCPLVEGQPIYAVDVSVWARCDAETSPGRGYYYHPSRHSAGQPIVAGWAYQWLSQLSGARNSWTAPLDVQRVYPTEETNTAAATMVARLVRRLPADGPTPRFVFDAGYDSLQLALDLTGVRAALLVRLRKDRCFYGEPLPSLGCRDGRPRRHGAKFAFRDPTTWPSPHLAHQEEDDQYGLVRVRAWRGLHAKPQTHAGSGSYAARPIVSGTIVRVEVSRLPGHARQPQVLWLWWSGSGTPDLALLWRAYVRRFDQEHTFRFLKGTLNWTLPRFRHPVQADRWSWLVLVAYTYLRLARPLVADQRLPWERPLRSALLTPCRVRRAVSSLLACLATPATPPKPCGRSPGRPKGARSGSAPRYPALKRAA
ncbi:MAG: NF041680 family putative transposase [Chloroflexota bacterium]